MLTAGQGSVEYHQRPALLSSFPLYQVCDDRQLPWSRVCNDPQQVKDLSSILTNPDFPTRHKKSIVGHTANNTPALTRWTLASWLEPSSLTSVHIKGRLCGSRICRSLWRSGAPGEILEQHQDFWGACSCHQLPYQVTWFKSGGGASGGAEDHSQDARQVPQGGYFHFLCQYLLCDSVVLYFYNISISCPIFLQISGDVSGFDCILVDDMVGVTESFHFSPNSLEKTILRGS